MKIWSLSGGSAVYTSNVYLVTGTQNRIEDINTLIDVGRDPEVIPKILDAPTGVGKKRIEQVILTHNHYDHAALLPQIRDLFQPRVYAFSSSLAGVDRVVKGGEILRIADRWAEIIHLPGHSSDSICIYLPEDGVLFSGDTSLPIRSGSGAYEADFLEAFQRVAQLDVKRIYPGHGEPVLEGCNALIRTSLRNAVWSTRCQSAIA